jgi:hypothetical protein
MSTAGDRLVDLVRADPVEPGAIAEDLDRLSPSQRREAMESLGGPGRGAELWGYNHQSLAWLTGPGYFVVHEDPARGAAIDYRRVPPKGCPTWPSVKPNDQGLSRFVYRGMVDYLRRVSREVLIGRATRGGVDLDNYFLLCRAG